jgi:DNA-binding response OmpR family regulator
MKKILLVEPDRVLGNIYLRSLIIAKNECLLVTNAEDAIHAIDSFKPDVIILEIQLVEHSGIELIYEIRSYREFKNIRLIILSGVNNDSFNTNRRLFRDELGVDKYFYKPHTQLIELNNYIKSL